MHIEWYIKELGNREYQYLLICQNAANLTTEINSSPENCFIGEVISASNSSNPPLLQAAPASSTMLSSAIGRVLLLLGGAALSVKAADNCTDFPTWTIKNFETSTSDSVGNSGKASFTLINSLTNTSDDLTCVLVANYRCEIAGTPSDKNLSIIIAIRSAALTVSLDQTLDCPDRTTCVSVSHTLHLSTFRANWTLWLTKLNDARALHVIGDASLDLACTEASAGENYTCSLPEGVIPGLPVELAPGR